MQKLKITPYVFMGIGYYHLLFVYWERPIGEGWYYIVVPFAIGLLLAITVDLVAYFKERRHTNKHTRG